MQFFKQKNTRINKKILLLFLQTYFYNDIKRLYNAKGNIRKQAKAIRYSSSDTSYAYLYCIFLVYSYHSTTNYRKYANFIRIFLAFSYIYCNFATTNE